MSFAESIFNLKSDKNCKFYGLKMAEIMVLMCKEAELKGFELFCTLCHFENKANGIYWRWGFPDESVLVLTDVMSLVENNEKDDFNFIFFNNECAFYEWSIECTKLSS